MTKEKGVCVYIYIYISLYKFQKYRDKYIYIYILEYIRSGAKAVDFRRCYPKDDADAKTIIVEA